MPQAIRVGVGRAAGHLSSTRKTMIRKVDPVHFFNAMGEFGADYGTPGRGH